MTQPDELADLYENFAAESLVPLWTQIGDLMPPSPQSKADAHLWRWETLLRLAEQAGDLVPVGRGGERRAIALANPALGGQPFATPTLWAAIQYLMPGENAPEHRHSQHAFRFVVEGSGVSTIVNDDLVPMRRGDFLPQGGMNWHAHRNEAAKPMAWIDGLDIPFQYAIESQFFDPGREVMPANLGPSAERSRSEQLWGHPGIAPLSGLRHHESSPLLCYRWEDTDAALNAQLALERQGVEGATVSPGHAAIRFTNPTNGRDCLPTIRAQFHRLLPRFESRPRLATGSSVFQVFDGCGTVSVGDQQLDVGRGDLFVVPSWTSLSMRSDASPSNSESGSLDLFEFNDMPIFERLDLNRTDS